MAKTRRAKRVSIDEQTGKTHEIVDEGPLAVAAAGLSAAYLLLTLGFFLWLLFDVWSGGCTLLERLGYDKARLTSPTFRLFAFTAIGGALGAIVNGVRSVIMWHCEEKAFGPRYFWKYLGLPWVGLTLALFLYAFMRSGMAVVGGNFALKGPSPSTYLTGFAAGVLAGYGSQKFYKWLDALVNRLLRVNFVRAPNLLNATRDNAEGLLRNTGLTVGKVEKEVREDGDGKVVSQMPPAGQFLQRREAVNFTVAVKPEKAGTGPGE